MRDEKLPTDYKRDPILPKHFDQLFANTDLDNPWLLLDKSNFLMEAAMKMTDLSRIYKGDAKGSIKQYNKYYPEDQGLSTLTKIMEEI